MLRKSSWVALAAMVVGAGSAGSALAQPASGAGRGFLVAVSERSVDGGIGRPVVAPAGSVTDATAAVSRVDAPARPEANSDDAAVTAHPVPLAVTPAAEPEPLVLVAPALAVGQGLASGGPANLQLLTSVALSRLGFLPEAARDVLFDQYARGFEAVTGGSRVVGEFLAGADTASSSMSPVVNPPARAVGGVVVEGGASFLEALGDLGTVGGQGSSFPRWFAATVRQLGASSGVAPAG